MLGKLDKIEENGVNVTSIICRSVVSDIAVFLLKRDVKLQPTICRSELKVKFFLP